MKKILAISTFLVAATGFATTCYVDLVDGRHVIQTFRGNDYYSGTCRDALRACNRVKQQQNYSYAECEKSNGYGYNNGGYNNGGYNNGGYNNGNNNYGNQFSYLLNRSDRELAQMALNYQVGSCTITRGDYWSSCDYYVKVNNQSFPESWGTGCAKRDYNWEFGCNFYNEKENAGCLIRKAIRENRCSGHRY